RPLVLSRPPYAALTRRRRHIRNQAIAGAARTAIERNPMRALVRQRYSFHTRRRYSGQDASTVHPRPMPSRPLSMDGRRDLDLGFGTVTWALPLFPSLVAVIVALPPCATSITRPVGDTGTTVGALDVHVTVRPLSAFPRE